MSLPLQVKERLDLAKIYSKKLLNDELDDCIDHLLKLSHKKELPATNLTSLITVINFDLNINLSTFPGIDVSCYSTSLQMLPNENEMFNFVGQPDKKGDESSANDFQDAPSSPINSILSPTLGELPQQSISPQFHLDPIVANDSLNSSFVNPVLDNHENVVLEMATESVTEASSLFGNDVDLCAPMGQFPIDQDTSPLENQTFVPSPPSTNPMAGLVSIHNSEPLKKLPIIESPKKQAYPLTSPAEQRENRFLGNVTKPFASFRKIPKLSASKKMESDSTENKAELQLRMNADNNAAPVEKQISVEEGNSKRSDDYVNPVNIWYINCIVPNCSTKCPSKNSLNIHLIEAHRIMENRCPAKSCKFSCNKLSKLLKHRKSAHGHLKSWNCDKCSKSFSDQLELSDHKEVEHTRGRFECGRGCGYWNKYWQPVKDHFRACGKKTAVFAKGDTENKQPRIGSSRALTSQKRPTETDMHIEEPSKKQKAFLMANTAKLSTSRNNSLDQFELKAEIHQSVKMTPTISAFVQPLSPVKDIEKSGTRYRTEYLYCLKSDCDGTFPNSHELNYHLQVAHGIQNFRCPFFICMASFAESEKLRRHCELVHRKVTSWQCFACKDLFPSFSKLSRHIELVHYAGLFRCVIKDCHFVGNCRQKTIEHYNSSHQNDKMLTTTIVLSTSPSSPMYSSPANPVVEPPPFTQFVDHSNKYEVVSVKCLLDSCAEYLLSIEKLNIHLEKVHSLLPVLCPASGCKNSFNNGLELDQHVANYHRDVTQWKCAKCGLMSYDHTHLNIHLRDVHYEGFFKCSFAGPPPCCKLHKSRWGIIQHFVVHELAEDDEAYDRKSEN